MDFVAIDVETANANMASICQVGIAKFQGGILVEEWKTYVDPESHFDGMNVAVHGITERTVKGAPILRDLMGIIYGYLDGAVAVCHTHFDRVAMAQGAQRYGVRPPSCTWLDSARVARRTWEQFAFSGYGLSNVAREIGYEFLHHDALEDAKAAGHVLVAAIKKSSIDLWGWLERVNVPINVALGGRPIPPAATKRVGNSEGWLHGEVVVFTGALSLPRHEAADLAAAAGCQVAGSVSKKVTILVVGDQDVERLAGHEKSMKHRRAEELIASGAPIRIMRETDFREFIRLSGPLG